MSRRTQTGSRACFGDLGEAKGTKLFKENRRKKTACRCARATRWLAQLVVSGEVAARG